MRRFGPSLLLFFLLAGSVPEAGQTGSATSPAPSTASSSALEREARQIETLLVAPCCWREQVSIHQSEAADQVKQEIRAMLGAGLTRQQVLDRFVAAYGTRILVEPPDQGLGRVLHHLPWLAGGISLAGLIVFLRRVTARRQTTVPDAAAAVPTGTDAERSYEERLDDELRDLD